MDVDAKLYSLKIDDIYLTPDSEYAVLRFHCPACSRVTEETLPIFVAQRDETGATIFWECPHCSTYMRLEKNDLRNQVADSYQARLDGYKKVINHGYVKQGLIFQQKESSPPLSKSALKHNRKESLRKTWIWPLLYPVRFIFGLFCKIREIIRRIHKDRNKISPECRLRTQYGQLQEQYRKDVLSRLPWYLEDDDAREALAFAHALRPILFIRFGILYSRPIGNFTMCTILYAKEKLAGMHDSLDYFYFDIARGCSNYAFLDIISRTINISPIVPQLFHMEYMAQVLASDLKLRKEGDSQLWQSFLPRVRSSNAISPHCFYMLKSYDNHSLDRRIDIQLSFTEQERDLAQEELAMMGIPAGSKIACLHVRDSAYYGENEIASRYRNVNIDLYRKAAEYLASLDYFVLRTGAKVAAPLQWAGGRIIDYATKYRSEFMDIWLFANANLTLGSGSGPDAIPYILGRHALIANYTELGYSVFLSYPNISILPAHCKKNGKRIGLREFTSYFLHNESDLRKFREKGFSLEIDYVSQDEVLEAVKEKLDIIDGKKISSDDMRLQRLFRTLLIKNAQTKRIPSNVFPYEKETLYGHLRGLISSVYLRQYRDELESGKENWEH